MANNENNTSTKHWLTALILCWFLGFFGVHRLYAGKLGSGFLMAYGTIVAICALAVNVWLGITGFVIMAGFVVYDFIIIAIKRFKDCYGKDLVEDKLN